MKNEHMHRNNESATVRFASRLAPRHLPALLSIALACVAGNALASDWRPLDTGENASDVGVRVEYDAKSIQRTGPIVSVWERTTYDTPRQIGGGPLTGYLIENVLFDCDAATLRQAHTLTVDLVGNVVYSGDSTSPARPVAPGTHGADSLDYFCHELQES